MSPHHSPSRRRLLASVLIAIAVAWQAYGARSFMTEVTLFEAKEGGYFIHRNAALLTTTRGTILAFCEARMGSPRDAAPTDVVLRRSLDNGKTWTPTQVVGHFPNYTADNAAPVQDRKTGVIWLLLTANPAWVTEKEISNSSPRGTRTVWITHSNDDGATWSRAQEITSSIKRPDWTWYATGPGNGIQLHDGLLVIPCDHKVAVTQAYYSHVIYSDDDGKTWKLGGSAGPQTNECAVVQLADGSLLLNMRSDAGRHLRAISYSHDSGLSWSAIQFDPVLIEPVCEASFIRYTLARNGGRNRLLFANPADTVLRDRLTVRLSYDEGKTWPVARRVTNGEFSDYSSLAVLPDGTIGLAYDRGNGKATPHWGNLDIDIVFAHFNLQWLTHGADHLGSKWKP